MRYRNVTALVLLAVFLTGCNSGTDTQQVVPVSGRVFLGDEPLTFGTVLLQPQRGQSATGSIGADGTFKLSTFAPNDGAIVGKHKVRVVCYTSQERGKGTDQESDSLGESLIPEKYTNFATSGLELFVVAGGNAPYIIRLEPASQVDEAQDPSVDPQDSDEAGAVTPDAPPSTESSEVPAASEGPPVDDADTVGETTGDVQP